MKTKTKKVFYCDHCNKHALTERSMAYHETICHKNPVNKRPCFNCTHLTKKDVEVCEDGYGGSEFYRTYNTLHCEKKNLFLFPPKTEIKGNAIDLGNYENEPMPKECELFNDLF